MSDDVSVRKIERQYLTREDYLALIEQLNQKARLTGQKEYEIYTGNFTILVLPNENKWISVINTGNKDGEANQYFVEEHELPKDRTICKTDVVFATHFGQDEEYDWPESFFNGRNLCYADLKTARVCPTCNELTIDKPPAQEASNG